MARKNILCLFDVDGTLTKPRQKISTELKTFLLNKVKPAASIGLVSGSDFCKISEQMDGDTAQFDYVFCENGLVYYQNGKLISQASIIDQMGENKLQKLINFALGYLSKVELPIKRGNFIELRSSLINISPIGRSCSQHEREQFALYDSEHGIRQKFVEILRKEFSDYNLTFALGGQISIDVFPKGWDKTFCLNHIREKEFSQIHFFGDKTQLGGNDYELYVDERTIGHQVMSPEDTEQKLCSVFKL